MRRRRLCWDLERKRELAERVVREHETCKQLAEAYDVGYFQMYRLLTRDVEVGRLIREALDRTPAARRFAELTELHEEIIMRSIGAAMGIFGRADRRGVESTER